MCDDVFTHDWELASLICEQSALIGKGTGLNPEEKLLFRVRRERIEQLLNGMICDCSANRQQKLPAPSARWIYLN
jgi:hypothetical protein